MRKGIISCIIILTAISLLVGALSVPSLAFESTGNEIFDAFISDPRWADGGAWGWKTPEISPYRGYQCCAYCCDFVQYCFGISNPRGGIEFTDIREIRAGDVITVGNQSNGYGHWMCVLNRIGDKLYTAEGNYAGVIRVGWYYTINGTELEGASYSFSCGYHYLDGPTNPPAAPEITMSKRILGFGEFVTLSWAPARNADYYIVSCWKGDEHFIWEEHYAYSTELSFWQSGEYNITVVAVNSLGQTVGEWIPFKVNLPVLPCNNPWYFNSNMYDTDYSEADFSGKVKVPNSPSFTFGEAENKEQSLACEVKTELQ